MINKKITIVLKAISRSSGGESSALDLAEAINSLGFDLNILLTVINNNTISGRHNLDTSLPQSRILFCKNTKIVNQTNSIISKLFYWTNKTLNLIDNSTAWDIIKDSEIIIDTSGDHIFLELIRKYSNAKVIGNHAGSPHGFVKYWMTDFYRKKDKSLAMINSKEERYRRWCKKFDGMLFQSHLHKAECIEFEAINQKDGFVVLPTCQEEKVISARFSENPYMDKSCNIVCMGSINPNKGQLDALYAFKTIMNSYSDCSLHFVGDGLDTDYGKYLKETVTEYDMDKRVFFYGHRFDYLRYMAHADILLQTSEAEGVSRVLREAMCMKIPIVSYDISGTRSILKDGEEALLSKYGDISMISDSLKKVLSDKEFAERLSENAFKRYLNYHSRVKYLESVQDMIRYFSQ